MAAKRDRKPSGLCARSIPLIYESVVWWSTTTVNYLSFDRVIMALPPAAKPVQQFDHIYYANI